MFPHKMVLTWRGAALEDARSQIMSEDRNDEDVSKLLFNYEYILMCGNSNE